MRLYRSELQALRWFNMGLKVAILSMVKLIYEVNGKLQLNIPQNKGIYSKLAMIPDVGKAF